MEAIENQELRTRVLLSTYRAMLGMISKDIRLISIDWGIDYFFLKAVFDRTVNDEDLELLKEISSEIAADLPQINNIQEFAEFNLEPVEKIKGLKELVFLRYGELEH